MKNESVEAVSLKYKMITSADTTGAMYKIIPIEVLSGLSDEGYEIVFMTLIQGAYYIQVKRWE